MPQAPRVLELCDRFGRDRGSERLSHLLDARIRRRDATITQRGIEVQFVGELQTLGRNSTKAEV